MATDAAAKWLVPNAERWERYPVTVRLAAASSFEKLAIAPSDDSILAFANKWGWLGEPVPLVRAGQGLVTSASSASGLLQGERLSYWHYELEAFLERVEVLRAVEVMRDSDAHLGLRVAEARSLLASRIEWVNGGVRYRGRQETAYPTTRWILWPPGDQPQDLVERFHPPERFKAGDVVGPARFEMFREVNEILREHVHPGVPAFTETPVIRLFPTTLIGAIYVRFVFDGLGVDARERQCPACGAYYTYGNRKRVYCSEKCRMAFNHDLRKPRRGR